METFILYAFITTSLYYVGCRAKITQPLWSRYPAWLDEFMLCAACTGFWWGLMLGVIGAVMKTPFLGQPGRSLSTPLLVAISSIVSTPLLAALHLYALDRTAGTTQGQDDAKAKES